VKPTVRSGYGHGKLILLGEHAVVYGYPAIALSVDRGTRVVLSQGPRNQMDPRLAEALDTVLPRSTSVHIETDLPIGRGMGSSAALAVAVARAQHPDAPQNEIYERAMTMERVFHGTPSGVDVAVASLGGVLRFQKGPPLSHASLPCPDWSLTVLDTQRTGNTQELVAGVAARRPEVNASLARIGALVEEAADALSDANTIGKLMNENQAILKDIGVSTPKISELVTLARRYGALGAKLSGAGGGGIVIALCTDPADLLRAAAQRDIPAFTCRPSP
jgi:mevalonate kinase